VRYFQVKQGEISFVKREVFRVAKHVNALLAAYVDGALTPEDTQRVEAHLPQCARCRQTHEAMRRAMVAMSDTRLLTAPETLWARVEETLAVQNTSGQVGAKPRVRPVRTGYALVALLLLFASGSALRWQWMNRRASQTRPLRILTASWKSWKVERLAGLPLVQTTGVINRGRLGVGESLTTDAHSRARIEVADIGQVDVAPNSRIRLVQTQARRHQLSLDRGELSARVIAPPRLFLVQTPSALAVDLGCAYTLNVDKSGNSRLQVTSGHVALADNGRETEVPAGAVCLTRKGTGTGTPFFVDAPLPLQTALEQIDFAQGGDRALDIILFVARPRDTLTLWNLLGRVTDSQRRRVIDSLLTYVALPPGVTRDGIQRLDARMLAQWKAQMELFWVAMP
jgi:hypothetical protein